MNLRPTVHKSQEFPTFVIKSQILTTISKKVANFCDLWTVTSPMPRKVRQGTLYRILFGTKYSPKMSTRHLIEWCFSWRHNLDQQRKLEQKLPCTSFALKITFDDMRLYIATNWSFLTPKLSKYSFFISKNLFSWWKIKKKFLI